MSGRLCVQQTLELFLKADREKRAALAASEKRPKTMRKALKKIKSSTSNQKAVLGRTLAVTARQVAAATRFPTLSRNFT